MSFLHDLIPRMDISGAVPEVKHDLIEAQGIIPHAQAFHVTNEFRDSMHEVFPDSEAYLSTLHLFKLPYAAMWIENFCPLPERKVGALLVDLSKSKPQVVVKMSDEIINIETKIICFDSELLENGMNKCWVASAIFNNLDLIFKDGDSVSTKMIINDQSSSKFLVEIVMRAIGTIIRINSPKVTALGEEVSMERLNKKRKRNGKQPLLSYRTVDLSTDVKAAFKASSNSESEDSKRLHWRRGHFKRRETGIFWWSPHLAGKSPGAVIHDYKT